MRALILLLLLVGCNDHKGRSPAQEEPTPVVPRKYEYEFHLEIYPPATQSHVVDREGALQLPQFIVAYKEDHWGFEARAKLVIHGIGECFYKGYPTKDEPYQYLEYCTGFTDGQIIPANTEVEMVPLDGVYMAGWCWYFKDGIFSPME